MATRNPSLNIVPSLKMKATSSSELGAAEAELHGPRGDWWWTGVKPSACPGFDDAAGVLRCVCALMSFGFFSRAVPSALPDCALLPAPVTPSGTRPLPLSHLPRALKSPYPPPPTHELPAAPHTRTHCRSSLPLPNTATASRADAIDYFNNAWTTTEVRRTTAHHATWWPLLPTSLPLGSTQHTHAHTIMPCLSILKLELHCNSEPHRRNKSQVDVGCYHPLSKAPAHSSTHPPTQPANHTRSSSACAQVLFAALQGTEAFLRQPYHQLRHPMVFYYVHPAVLYINKFRVAGLLDAGIDQFIEQLFETGVDEMSWDDLSQGRDDWPSIRDCHAYRCVRVCVCVCVCIVHASALPSPRTHSYSLVHQPLASSLQVAFPCALGNNHGAPAAAPVPATVVSGMKWCTTYLLKHLLLLLLIIMIMTPLTLTGRQHTASSLTCCRLIHAWMHPAAGMRRHGLCSWALSMSAST